jgi:hypothetical protein
MAFVSSTSIYKYSVSGLINCAGSFTYSFGPIPVADKLVVDQSCKKALGAMKKRSSTYEKNIFASMFGFISLTAT